MNSSLHKALLIAIALLAFRNLELAAQQPDSAPNEKKGTEVEGRVLEQEQIRPAFRAEPIVHRMEARRGQTLPFEYTLYSSGRPTRLLIKPIAITQRENGVIASDESVPAPPAIQIEGPEIIDFGTGDDHVIKGRVRVPIVQSTFHSFGILVRDLGLESDQPSPRSGNNLRFGVRFVTQYLLRCDITVQGARPEDLSEVIAESVELQEEEGRAKLSALIVNPTDSPMQFEVHCQIRNQASSTEHPDFALAMPVRMHMSPPEKHMIKILPKTRLRLEEFVPHPLSDGKAEVVFKVVSNRKVGATTTLPVAVDLKEFPAQNRELVAIADGLTAQPGHIELSLARGGKRLSPVKIENTSSEPVEIECSVLDRDGEVSRFVDVRPTKAVLRPGASRNVLLMLKSTSELTNHKYGTLQVVATRSGTQLDTRQSLKVAMVSREPSEAKLSFENMTWDETGKTPALLLPVTNVGGKHLPLNATLTVTSVDGASLDMPAGYGRWLLPGEKDVFRFRFKNLPPPGQYGVRLVVDLGPDREPIETTSSIQFTASTSNNSNQDK